MQYAKGAYILNTSCEHNFNNNKIEISNFSHILHEQDELDKERLEYQRQK